MMYDSWDTKCNRQIFFSHLGPFFTVLPPSPSPNNPKNQNFEKMKQNARDIIILHKSTINDNHDIWFLRYINCNRQNFLSYWDIFCPFTPLTAQKVKISEKWKKHISYEHIIILHKCTKNHDHRLYCSWDMVHDRCNCYFSFWAIFALLPL